MATKTASWTPFGVAMTLTVTSATVTRTSATEFTVKITAKFSAPGKTDYGMDVSSGGKTITINDAGVKTTGDEGSFTGTYTTTASANGNKDITVTFKNYNPWGDATAKAGKTRSIALTVNVPAWTSYTISYDLNGAEGSIPSTTKYKGVDCTLSSKAPTRTGYTFLGWSTSSTATTATYKKSGTYTKDESTTLYAVWKAITYTITYNANGGSGAPSSTTKTYDVTLKLSTLTPKRTGYTFLGWSTSSTATTATYKAGANYTANAKATLYAVWTLSYNDPTIKNISTIRCDKNGNPADDGTRARIKFDWVTYQEVKSVSVTWVNNENLDSTYAPTGITGTSGSIDVVIPTDFMVAAQPGVYTFDTDKSYEFTITVSDDGGSTTKVTTLSTQEFPIDVLAEGKGIAFGKAAELAGVADFGYDGIFRKNVCVGDKRGYLDGNQGVYIDDEGYIHLQRSTEKGYHPYVGFFLGDATAMDGVIRLNSSSGVMEFMNADSYSFDKQITQQSDERLKKDFAELDRWSDFYYSLKPVAYKMKNESDDRYKIGFKAQQVEQALTDSGLSNRDFAGIVKTKYVNEEHDPEGTTTYEEIGIKPGDYVYKLAYTEFVALNTYEIQKLRKENDELKDKIASLEARLAKIESLLSI
jgi:uncharacterized repeat protein (TIGR02543 family)